MQKLGFGDLKTILENYAQKFTDQSIETNKKIQELTKVVTELMTSNAKNQERRRQEDKTIRRIEGDQVQNTNKINGLSLDLAHIKNEVATLKEVEKTSKKLYGTVLAGLMIFIIVNFLLAKP